MPSKDAKSITLDELLAEQQRTKNTVTIEPVEGNPGLVTITPWTQNAGCLCSSSFRVSKQVIKSLSKTDHTHFCCGKTLLVVEVEFSSGASVTVESLLAARDETAHRHGHVMPAAETVSMTGAPSIVPASALGLSYRFPGEPSSFSTGTQWNDFSPPRPCPLGCPPGWQCCVHTGTGRSGCCRNCYYNCVV